VFDVRPLVVFNVHRYDAIIAPRFLLILLFASIRADQGGTSPHSRKRRFVHQYQHIHRIAILSQSGRPKPSHTEGHPAGKPFQRERFFVLSKAYLLRLPWESQ